MQEAASFNVRTIKEIFETIHECWQRKDYDRMGSYVAENVVIAPPKSQKRLVGRAVYIQSYRDYDQTAKTIEYKTGDPLIDIIDDTAVVVCPFEVVFGLNDASYHEAGEN